MNCPIHRVSTGREGAALFSLPYPLNWSHWVASLIQNQHYLVGEFHHTTFFTFLHSPLSSCFPHSLPSFPSFMHTHIHTQGEESVERLALSQGLCDITTSETCYTPGFIYQTLKRGFANKLTPLFS